MHLFLDDARPDALGESPRHPLVHGVTTNPTLLARAGVSGGLEGALAHLQTLLDRGAARVQAQVLRPDTAGMLEQAARMLAVLDPARLTIKIPATRDGLAAGARLIASGTRVTFTAVYGVEQAAYAAMLGADYAAPYLGRLLDQGVDGLDRIARMQAIVQRENPATRLLVASVRSREAFESLVELGVGAITVPVALFPQIIDHPDSLQAERGFLEDAARLG